MGTKRQHIGCVALLVRDYDEAKAFYCQVMGFDLIEDSLLPDGKRWVLVAPPGGNGTRLLLAKAANPLQSQRIGDQAGGRVFLFLYTDDIYRDVKTLREKGVRFREVPRKESYGIVAVFEDLYGNRWDLLQPSR
jgi:catechol 2,3-dioxygenase-like lactoylglutathione lyase family enzyme